MDIKLVTGSFELLTPVEELKRQLLAIESAGRTCYQSEHGAVTLESSAKFIEMLLGRAHESVIEHSSLTVRFSGISRGFTHEMVRHRLASFSQESTRYVDYTKRGEGGIVDPGNATLEVVLPPHRDIHAPIEIGEGVFTTPEEMLQQIANFYTALRKAGWVAQDARQLLPIATESEIVVTANFRQWRHIMKMRTAKAAHWEIRNVMCNLLVKLKEHLPIIFEDFELAGEDKNGVPHYTVA